MKANNDNIPFMGIKIDGIIEPPRSMTEAEEETFVEVFIDLVERHGFVFAGTIGLTDLNETDED